MDRNTTEGQDVSRKRKIKPCDKGADRNRRAAAKRPISLAPLPVTWDLGATGPAARAREIVIEDAADIDPETGEIVNPNGIKRARVVDMLEVWHIRGTISTGGYNYAVKLRDAYEATQRTPGWPDNDRVQASPRPDLAVAEQADRLTDFLALSRYIHPADRPVIDWCVLGKRDVAGITTGQKLAAATQALGAALDRAVREMDHGWRLRRIWDRIAKIAP